MDAPSFLTWNSWKAAEWIEYLHWASKDERNLNGRLNASCGQYCPTVTGKVNV